jgi:hypothetical protein
VQVQLAQRAGTRRRKGGQLGGVMLEKKSCARAVAFKLCYTWSRLASRSSILHTHRWPASPMLVVANRLWLAAVGNFVC